MEAMTMEVIPAKPQEIAASHTPVSADFMPVMSMEIAKQRYKMLVEFTKDIMHEGQDYGVIPGTGTKPALLKAGAEKLCSFFGLEPEFTEVAEDADWTGERHGGELFYYIRYRAVVKRGGRTLGVGEGSANSWEAKYRWRQGARKCPKCGKESIIQGKEEFGGGWLCWKKKDGCGTSFKIDDPAVAGQQVGRVPNPDIADQINTIQKMAQKRALVAAVLIGTGASEFYTQDIEDVQPGSAVRAAEVRDRKIAELREKAQPTDDVPVEVQKLWDRMGSKREAIKDVLADLYADLRELAGDQTGRGIYDDIIKRFAAGDPIARVGLARRTVLELWKAVDAMKRDAGDEQRTLIEEEAIVYAD